MLLVRHKSVLSVLACAWLLAFAAAPALADKRDHNLARQALQDGAVLSLRAILDIVQTRYPGQVMAVEFEHDDGQFVYEIKVLQRQGKLVKLKLDARTGKPIKAKHKEGKDKENKEQQDGKQDKQEKHDKKRKK